LSKFKENLEKVGPWETELCRTAPKEHSTATALADLIYLLNANYSNLSRFSSQEQYSLALIIFGAFAEGVAASR
jgi:hypothetical protein